MKKDFKRKKFFAERVTLLSTGLWCTQATALTHEKYFKWINFFYDRDINYIENYDQSIRRY